MYRPRIIFGMPNKGYKNTYKNTAIQLQPLTALVINHQPLFVNLLDLLVQHRVADTQLNFHLATNHLSSIHNLKSRERLIIWFTLQLLNTHIIALVDLALVLQRLQLYIDRADQLVRAQKTAETTTTR